jgi:hypothetical protein
LFLIPKAPFCLCHRYVTSDINNCKIDLTKYKGTKKTIIRNIFNTIFLVGSKKYKTPLNALSMKSAFSEFRTCEKTTQIDSSPYGHLPSVLKRLECKGCPKLYFLPNKRVKKFYFWPGKEQRSRVKLAWTMPPTRKERRMRRREIQFTRGVATCCSSASHLKAEHYNGAEEEGMSTCLLLLSCCLPPYSL